MNPAALAHEVMRMLELRHSSDVPGWAAMRLAELCKAHAHRVLRVFPVAAARMQGQPAAAYAITADAPMINVLPTPIHGDPDLAGAIARRKPVHAAGDGRLLVPLAAGDEVRHLIELRSAAAAGPGGEVAAQLIPIIASYYDLLVDAETDPLTRLANRRVFYSQVAAAMAHLAVGARMRFLALADIDHFKQINDRFGHLYGDEILIHFARLMRETFRAGDLLYRFGGEEFIIIYEADDREDRCAALERFRGAVERYEFPQVGRVTASLGFTALAGPMVPATTLVDRADDALYYAKRNGRNRVCEFEALVAAGAIALPQPEAGGDAELF